MDKAGKNILVAHDFTDKAGFAVSYAENISKRTGDKIHLLHVVKKDSEKAEALSMLEKIADEIAQKTGKKPECISKEGTIFSAIGEAAEETHAHLVIMGTHGIRGMQKLTGSWALKVIVSSQSPFLVVQAPPEKDSFEKIVFPIDFRRENKENNLLVQYLHTYYKSKIYLIKPRIKDQVFLRKVNSNMVFAKNFLDGKGIDYEIHTAEGKGKFADETITFAQEIDADVIVTVATRNIGFTDYAFGAQEQYIIANSAKIPVMCINPRSDIYKSSGGFSASGG